MSFNGLRQACIVGAQGLVLPKSKPAPSNTSLVKMVLANALNESKLSLGDVEGILGVSALAEKQFMQTHLQATELGMFDQKRPLVVCKTVDTCGAGPVTALIEASRLIRHGMLDVVAIVAADTVGSMNTQQFLERADEPYLMLAESLPAVYGKVISPCVPNGYDRATDYHMKAFGLVRDQLRMTVCLESFHAGMHPDSLFRRQLSDETKNCYTTLDEVQASRPITPNISLLECARRADGAGCLIVASDTYLKDRGLYTPGMPIVIGEGEGSAPLYPALEIKDDSFSSQNAMDQAYASAGNLTARDIDFFGLYDCFPICLIRAIEAAGLAPKGKGGLYLEEQHVRLVEAVDNTKTADLSADNSFFPINTHGGLLCYGAPWAVPAIYNLIEAVDQLNGKAKGRQINNCQKALCYGNGGVLSSSAVAILSKSD